MEKNKLFIAGGIRLVLLFFIFLILFIVLMVQIIYNPLKYVNFTEAPKAPLPSNSSNVYTSDATITLSNQQPATTVSLSGTAKLNSSPDSLVRVLLLDDKGNEYLIYETNNGVDSTNTPIALNNACQETCQFGPITPASIKIKITKGSLTITSLNTTNLKTYSADEQSASLASKRSAELKKVQAMIKKNHLTWTAGETPISNLSYSEKKKLFAKPDGTPVDELPNLQGFEYYKGGVFEIVPNPK